LKNLAFTESLKLSRTSEQLLNEYNRLLVTAKLMLELNNFQFLFTLSFKSAKACVILGIKWNIPFCCPNQLFHFWNQMEYSILLPQPIIPFLESDGIFHFAAPTKLFHFWNHGILF